LFDLFTKYILTGSKTWKKKK